ncbi:IS4 transposase [Rhodoferax antarcticus]|nr:IS4 transposase [Rhodoferax antarcticus]
MILFTGNFPSPTTRGTYRESWKDAFCAGDQSVALNGFKAAKDDPEHLRRVRFKDPMGKTLIFLTNNTALSAPVIAQLYKNRWQVELFFKWIKQHLRIKKFWTPARTQ